VEEEEEEEAKRLPEAPLYSLLSSVRRSGRSAKKSLPLSLCRSSVGKKEKRERKGASLPFRTVA